MLSIYKKLLFSMFPVYVVYKKELSKNDIEEYSTLIIDKFASQSSTFYHISTGFIESVHSTSERMLMGFDIFTFNSTFRALFETYVAFHGIFVHPKDDEEKKAKFLLWKMEGLHSKIQLEFEEDIVSTDRDKEQIKLLEDEFEKSQFYQTYEIKELNKIFKRGKIYNWKFIVAINNIEPFGRLKFSKIITKSTAIGNLYNLSSMHIHSGFYAIEQFKGIRGKIINDEYVNSYIIQAMYLTASLIIDLKNSSPVCDKAYNTIEFEVQEIIEKVYHELRAK